MQRRPLVLVLSHARPNWKYGNGTVTRGVNQQHAFLKRTVFYLHSTREAETKVDAGPA